MCVCGGGGEGGEKSFVREKSEEERQRQSLHVRTHACFQVCCGWTHCLCIVFTLLLQHEALAFNQKLEYLSRASTHARTRARARAHTHTH